MRIGVLLRQVPDPEARLEVSEGGVVVDPSVPWVLDESDEAALDAALRLAGDEDEVVALALGPERVEQGARKALALGAGRAVRVDDDPETPDRGALGERLAEAVRHESLDLLLAGAQTTSSGSGLVASSCAAALGWAWIWLVLDASFDESRETIEVVQELEAGRRRRWRVRTPVVLAVQTGRFQARMPTIRGVLAAKRATIETMEPGLSEPERSNRTRLARAGLERPAPASDVEWIEGDEAAVELARRLREDGLL